MPVAQGNDGGGSIRIPAACCGVVGLKPSRGRISRGPDRGDSFLVCEGVLTRTVLETAQLLDVLGGYEAGDATWAPRPVEPYATSIRRHPGRLRIAVSLDSPLHRDVHPESVRAVREAAGILAELGHEVVEGTPPFPAPDSLEVFLQVFGPGVALAVLSGELIAGRAAGEDDIEPLSRARRRVRPRPALHGLPGGAQLAAGRGAGHRRVLRRPRRPAHSGARRPASSPIGELHGCGEEPLADLLRSGEFAPFTALFNVTGQPAISVPLGFGEDRLPSAVQLVGRPLAEDTLLQVAGQLEQARPWAQHVPPLAA